MSIDYEFKKKKFTLSELLTKEEQDVISRVFPPESRAPLRVQILETDNGVIDSAEVQVVDTVDGTVSTLAPSELLDDDTAQVIALGTKVLLRVMGLLDETLPSPMTQEEIGAAESVT